MRGSRVRFEDGHPGFFCTRPEGLQGKDEVTRASRHERSPLAAINFVQIGRDPALRMAIDRLRNACASALRP